MKGTVIDVKDDEITLNIHYKADGIITRNEYSSDPNCGLSTTKFRLVIQLKLRLSRPTTVRDRFFFHTRE